MPTHMYSFIYMHKYAHVCAFFSSVQSFHLAVLSPVFLPVYVCLPSPTSTVIHVNSTVNVSLYILLIQFFTNTHTASQIKYTYAGFLLSLLCKVSIILFILFCIFLDLEFCHFIFQFFLSLIYIVFSCLMSFSCLLAKFEIVCYRFSLSISF